MLSPYLHIRADHLCRWLLPHHRARGPPLLATTGESAAAALQLLSRSLNRGALSILHSSYF